MVERSLVFVALLTAAAATACSPARPAANASPPTDLLPNEPRADNEADEPVEAAPAADQPPGDLVCRSSSTTGRTELFLTWSGSEATGVLRTIGRSGETTDARVRAERLRSMVVVDTAGSRDLVDHLAIVVDDGGKRRMRIADMGYPRIADCE